MIGTEQIESDDRIAARDKAMQELYTKYFPVFPLIQELKSSRDNWFNIACETFGAQAVATYLANETRLHAKNRDI